MQKGFYFLIMLGILVILNIEFSLGLGLSPAKIRINYKPNTNYTFNFLVVDAKPNRTILINVSGDFAEYVTLDKQNLTGGGSFTLNLSLPPKAKKPGPNKLSVRVGEVAEETEGIGVAVRVAAAIIIDVPYPGKYAEINLKVHDINEGEPLNLEVNVSSKGEEDIDAEVLVNIYDEDENRLETLNLGRKTVKSQTTRIFKKIFDTKNYGAGNYKAEALVYYDGKVANQSKWFRIGHLFVDIVNWTKYFEPGKLNKFNIEIESEWNADIDKVYAEVTILEKNNLSVNLTSFKTPPVKLKKWKKATLLGYLEAENLESKNYAANITIFYKDKTTSKIIEIMPIEKPFVEKYKFLIIAGSSFFLLIVIIVVSYFIYRKFRSVKNKK